MTNTTTNTILVVGSTGKTGMRIADHRPDYAHAAPRR
jgi:hypothetical protein